MEASVQRGQPAGLVGRRAGRPQRLGRRRARGRKLPLHDGRRGPALCRSPGRRRGDRRPRRAAHQEPVAGRLMPVSWTVLKMLAAVGILYLIMMGSTFSSLGVVIPHIIATLHFSFAEAGFGFTLLALAAGTSSMLPSLTIKRWNGRVTLALGVLAMICAYA